MAKRAISTDPDVSSHYFSSIFKRANAMKFNRQPISGLFYFISCANVPLRKKMQKEMIREM